jgi:FKBP-type peptidyl-prolyl cis-trans isomerase
MNRSIGMRIVSAIFLAVIGLSAVAQEAPKIVVDLGNTGLKDPSSYALGWNLGKQMSMTGMDAKDFQTAEVLNGFVDALSKSGKLSDEQLEAAYRALDERIKKKRIEIARRNLEQANEFLKANKEKVDGLQTTPTGLQYVVLASGKGKQPSLTSLVTVHYEGKLMDGTIFDSSIKRNEPAKFQVNSVFPGWTEALQRMKVGDKWRLFIPPGLGYGEQGSQMGDVGPNELMIFDFELLEVR